MPTARIQSAIETLLTEVPHFAGLPQLAQEHLSNLLWDRLTYVDGKFQESPFAPPEHGVNRFAEHSLAWAQQFPTEHQAGAALIALGLQYFTRDELSALLERCVDRFRREPVPGRSQLAARLFPLTSHTEIHAEFARKAGMEGTGDNSLKPPGHLEGFLDRAVAAFAKVAEGKPDLIYDAPDDYVNLLVNSHCVVVEDWALSGNTLTTAVSHLVRLLGLMFDDRDVQAALAAQRKLPPRVTVVLQIATNRALKRLSDKLSGMTSEACIYSDPIVGCTLDDTSRITRGSLPDWLARLDVQLPELNVREAVLGALEWFRDTCGSSFSSYMKAEGFPPELVEGDGAAFGFGSGGWLLAAHTNCPNNSPPVLWFSMHGGPHKYFPLLARSDSRHNSRAGAVEEWLRTIEGSPYQTRELRQAIAATISSSQQERRG